MAELRYDDGVFKLKTSYANSNKCKAIVGGSWNKVDKVWNIQKRHCPNY